MLLATRREQMQPRVQPPQLHSFSPTLSSDHQPISLTQGASDIDLMQSSLLISPGLRRSVMERTLLGPYELSFDTIDKQLPSQACGVFAVGYVDVSNTFRIERVGRDDVNLAELMRSLIGSSGRFKYAICANSKQAFEAECEIFHRFRPPGNFIHPVRPSGSRWRCPICQALG